jgi:hypothetical protein
MDAPPLVVDANVFVCMCATCRRVGGFSREECLAPVGTGTTLLRGREVNVDPEAAVGVAMDLELSAYDAQYVALALALKSILVTEDRTVLDRAPAVTRSLDSLE